MNKKSILFYILVWIVSITVSIGQEKSLTIGFIGKSQSNPVFMAAYAGARVAAKELGEKKNLVIKIDWQTPENESPRVQKQAIEKLTQSNVDGIAIACSDEKILAESINDATAHGIPVLCFDADAAQSNRFAYYGSDDSEFGRMIMKELAAVMKEKGTIAILGGNKNAPNLKKRVQAVLEELKNYPSMKLADNGIYYHEETPKKAAETVARAQKTNPHIEGWAFVGGWPLWSKNAISWKPGKIKIVAADALPEELEYLKSGHVQVLVAQNCFLWGYHSVELLLDKIITKENPSQKIIAGKLTRVSSENSEEWSLNWKKWLIREAVNR